MTGPRAWRGVAARRGDRPAGDPASRDPAAGAPASGDPAAGAPASRDLAAGAPASGDPTADSPASRGPASRAPAAPLLARVLSASPAVRLGVVRIAIFAMWLLVVVPDPLGYLAELPPAHPIGVFRWVPDGLVAAGAFKVVLVALLVACLVGLPGFSVLGVCAAALLTVHQAVLREFTFVNHEELALLVCTWGLVLFPAADAVSWPRRRAAPSPAPEAALFALSALLLLPYALIAAHRLAFAAPDVFTGESLPYWLASLSSLDRDGWELGREALGHPWLVTVLKAGFFVTTVFELLAPVCLVAPLFARVWTVVVVGFHLVNEFTLNLFFWQNTLLVILLIGWSSARPNRRSPAQCA